MENDNTEIPVCTTVEQGLAYSITATGRQLGVVSAEPHGLFKIKYIDGRSGSIPESMSGKYTGYKFAKADIDGFVRKTWQIASESTSKAVKQRRSKTEQEQTA